LKRKIKVFLVVVVVVIAIEEEITNKKKESEEKNVKNLHEDKKNYKLIPLNRSTVILYSFNTLFFYGYIYIYICFLFKLIRTQTSAGEMNEWNIKKLKEK